jgi:HTH-type transcriptional regulator, sugar sensing transcriptional regulator
MRLTGELAALQALGFTEIEARVYACLVQESPATGYRVSHLIGRPTPNTYKALASLAQKGAVILDDGDRRQCRAVPPEQLLVALERRFREDAERARAALASLRPAGGDDRVYQVRNVEQVLERARSMLAGTRTLALLDVFPAPLGRLHEALEGAARRVRVVAKVYAEAAVKGVELVRAEEPDRVRAAWPGQHLSLVCDAEEHLIALFSEDLATVYQAIWSRSTFLSCMHHNHLAHEILLAGGVVRAARTRQRSLQLTTAGVSGFKTLVRRYGPGGGGDGPKRTAKGRSR